MYFIGVRQPQLYAIRHFKYAQEQQVRYSIEHVLYYFHDFLMCLFTDLLEKVERDKDNMSTKQPNMMPPPDQSPKRRNSKPDCHDLQPKYTPEQLEAVRKYVE